ncbi:MAG TPA: uroporphyrinogen-III C-methyltransferase [Gemmatimonadales bacterium]|nr:uroporphyrinogen-III C-methyltransferase [Gemmatimonadales bacterium]
MSGRALVLAAHGSRRDPAANALVRRLAEALRGRRLFEEIAVAFHHGEPGFDAVLDELSADEVTVVPFLTSAGHYSEVVLPEALRRNHRFTQVRLRQTPPVGTHAGVAPLVARRVTALLREQQASRDTVGLVLVGHGTRRHPQSRTATEQLAETLQRRRVAGQTVAAFIDDDPPLDEVVAGLRCSTVLVVPFLIGGGAHTLEDIPRLVGFPQGAALRRGQVGGRLVLIDDAVGTYPGLEEIVVDLARKHTPPPAPRFRPRMMMSQRKEPAGVVHLVGGGPGDPGLITSRGLDLLRTADVVVHDRLIGPELLHEVRAGAELIDVGKGPGHAPYAQAEIDALLVEHAARGRIVVRLKGGDPFVFGRGSEEAAACRAAGVPVSVVPGVSSAIAAPAAAGIPVTARGLARSFAVVTAHTANPDGETADLRGLAAVDTLVILMGRASLRAIADQLVEAGRDPDTPAACIQSATTPEQRVTRATLATIAEAADRDGLQNPVVTVIGAVAALGDTAVEPGGVPALVEFAVAAAG